MSSLIAAVATRVADSADAVARSLGPVDPNGANSLSQLRATSHGPARVAELLQKNAQDVSAIAVRGKPFHISDIPAYVDAVKNFNGGAGIDDRKMLLEKLLVLMSRLPADNQFAKTLQVFVIDTLYKDLPHPPAAYLPSNPYLPSTGTLSYPSTNPSNYANGHANGHANGSADQTSTAHVRHPYSHPTYGVHRPYAARSADGSGYSTVYPDMGAAGKPYARTVPPTHPGINWPDAGLVFDALLKRQPSSGRRGILPSSDPNAEPGHSTLPATNPTGFARHPGGLSSLFFAFADLVIHSIFSTNHSDWSINNVSSYLDLSPLYGSSEKDLKKVRRLDGTGRLYEDVFADGRLLFMPPSVPALLVLFCRNHNYIASKLLTINEYGTYVSGTALEELNEDDKKAQDDEIFSRARLVNCGWFMQVILGDYVGAILGLVRDGCEWRLDPLAESRESDHSVSPRGQGNVVSLEFNLLYRWHAALSERDTAWTELIFEKVFGTRDFSSITVDQFQKTLAEKLRPDPDVRKWTFDGVDNAELVRDSSTGAFKDSDLAALLYAATEAPAGAFKARGIPEVLRVVEVMGIEQARQWGTATMNEFRKFMGLKSFSSFSEWNSDPDISRTAEMLYGNIDNLELYPGLMAEEAKPPIPGAGLCPGYTISRAILADAVALVRGDRFLTTDFTVYNLTSWGYLDCFSHKDDGAYGGILTRLLYRTLPEYYPSRSSYARFPFIVPSAMQGYLRKLVDSPVSKYEFKRPKAPVLEVCETRYETVKDILADHKDFRSDVDNKLVSLVGTAELDISLVNKALDFFIQKRQYPAILEHITSKLIAEKSTPDFTSGNNFKFVDIVHDVINLAPVYFVATELLGIPIKTEQTPHGLFRDAECASMFADICNYVLLNRDPYMDWVLRERTAKASFAITDAISEHLKRLAGQGIIGKVTDSLIQWYTGEDKFSDVFLSRVLESAPRGKHVTESIFATIVPTIALYSKSIVHIVDFFLKEEQTSARKLLVQLTRDKSVENDEKLYALACEALRLNPPVSSVVRQDVHGELSNGTPEQIYLSVAKANLDRSVFGENSIAADLEHPRAGLTGVEDYGLTSTSFLKSTVPAVLRAIFKLKNLRSAPGSRGTLRRIVETVHGCPEVEYLNERSEITPFPASMFVQYES
ncbi:hypothetical protein ACEPAH_7442 [Sanghuangporus vaninii]